jgi:hypothetical protein
MDPHQHVEYLPGMLPRVRAALLLVLMALAQPGPALAVACEPSSHHEHCAAHQDDGQRSGVPHEVPNCGAMLPCTAAVALPASPSAPLRSTVTREASAVRLILPQSREDRPANPPPRA